jgi:Leucine-rich repeat (LRR) protein
MDLLDENALFSIAIYLDYPELLRFCGSNKRINRLVCLKEPIWLYRLNKDYPNWRNFDFDKSPMEIYKTIWNLERLKDKLKLNYSLLELTNLEQLWLSNKQITTLPQEIGQLTNLQELWLYKNQLTRLPQEIGQLTNLQYLWLNNNQLTILPREIGQLTNLHTLWLHNNQLTSLPQEIGQLTNLQYVMVT